MATAAPEWVTGGCHVPDGAQETHPLDHRKTAKRYSDAYSHFGRDDRFFLLAFGRSEFFISRSAEEIQKTLRKNDIGNYYKEAIADLLSPEEREVLKLISQRDNEFPERLASRRCATRLENFGLVNSSNGGLQLTAELFRFRLENRVKH